MKTEIIIICITIIILYGMYLYYNYINPSVDEIVDEGPITTNNKRSGTWRLYKRTYKNGKVIHFEKNNG